MPWDADHADQNGEASITSDQQPVLFVGWLKDRLPWRQVAMGATVGDCWAELLKVPAVGQDAERVVLARGRHPNMREKAR